MKLNRNVVAKLAGVSSATVSRVYNHPEQVDAETTRKVREAAAKLGYVPDKNASALRRSGSGVILFCQRKISDSRADRYYKWFYADVLLAVTALLETTTYRLRLQQYESVEDLSQVVKSGQADALIAYGATDAEAQEFDALGLPYVCGHHLHNTAATENIAAVDERGGGAIAGMALRDAGAISPAHITGELARAPVCQERWEGFRSVFAGVDLPLINQGLGIMAGREAALKLWPLIRRKKVDSVFVVNDLTALGVVQVLIEKGVNIPNDVSIISYDNLPFIDALPVKLTTVDIDLGGLYREATSHLLDSLRTGARINIRHSPFLVQGESVRKQRE